MTHGSHGGFKVGDYVIADHAWFDVIDGTFVITALDFNLRGWALVHVTDITTLRSIKPRTLCFYPSELSWEDGTRPENA